MNNKSGSEQKCDECDFKYSYDPTDGGTVCVRCLKEKRDHLQKLCEEQKGEIERLKSDSSSGLSVKYKLELIKEINNLKSQLATQTERVKELEGVLKDLKRHNNHTIEEEMWRIDKVINQDSLKEK